jgi:putative ATP-dependent endonuclease of the OLD family
MKLKQIEIRGYRCFKELTSIPFQNLTVLIGENDCGKSSILKAIELLLTKSNYSDEDFFKLNELECNEFIIEGTFELTDAGNQETLKPFIIDHKIIFKKIFKKGLSFQTTIKKIVFEDIELETYSDLNAESTKVLLTKYRLPSSSTQDERRRTIKSYIDTEWENIPKTSSEVDINFNTIAPYLPIFQYYGSHDYGNPEALVRRTLENIYSSYFYNESGELKIKSIQGIKDKVLSQLNKTIEEKLLDKIQKYNPKIVNIQGRLDINFSKGLDFQGIELDEGQGYKLISYKGEGSKKRLFLSILEWDKEVQIGMTDSRAIIRAYDEPDSNLHYEAQRKMFYAISDLANNPKSNVQSIIATHSIAMIDRAPSNSVIHVLQNYGISQIDYLRDHGDLGILNFLNQISVIGGIKNSSIFYEKCFLLVEGDSEETAIPKIYKKFFDKSLSESGIVLINLQSNGAWFNFLKLLHRNKSSCTVLLLDTDTQNPNCGANVTSNKLGEIGFDDSFFSSNLFFAGVQEFEDVFPDRIIRDVFNKLYPRATKAKWNIGHIRDLRANYNKISKGFLEESRKHISHHHKNYKKPEFANELADLITLKELKNIEVLTALFSRIHQIVE